MTPPEKSTDEQPEADAQAEPKAEKKPAAKKPAAARRPPAKKESEQEPATAAASQAGEKKAPARKTKTSSKPKPAAAQEQAPAVEAKKADKPAPAARDAASAQAPIPRRKVVRAEARYVRTSARKARMVCGHLRGKSIAEARAILAFTPREVARDWSKLLESAVANAENNHELIEEDLFVREAFADEGPTIKRFRPRAQGRATPIRKRTSHLTITLTPKA
jgi:ribosomal protein L22